MPPWAATTHRTYVRLPAQGVRAEKIERLLVAAGPLGEQLGLHVTDWWLFRSAEEYLGGNGDPVRLAGAFLVTYGALQVIEGVGLWGGLRWAEYLAAVVTAAFIPLEVCELVHQPTPLVADVPATALGLLKRADRLLQFVGQVALLRVLLQQIQAHPRRAALRVAKGAPVLRRCLTVGPDGRGPGGRLGGDPQDGVPVTGLIGMMRDPSEIRPPHRWVLQRAHCEPVHEDSPIRRDGRIDGQPFELVAEGEGAPAVRAERTGGDALLERPAERPDECLEQPELGAGGGERERLEQASARRAQPRYSGNSAPRTVAGISLCPLASTSVT